MSEQAIVWSQHRAESNAKATESTESHESGAESKNTSRPWLVLVNAPIESRAHESLLELLESTEQKVQELILMGPAAAAACSDSKVGAKYGTYAKAQGLELMVCGMAAKDYGAQGDRLSENFSLTGFMEILLKVKKAKKGGVKIVVW